MNLNDAINVVESAPGFTDETTPVGEAWATVLASLSPPQPVSVAERLPAPEDCDAEGQCWLSTTEADPGWVLDYPERCTNWTHWLPAHALPVPGEGADG